MSCPGLAFTNKGIQVCRLKGSFAALGQSIVCRHTWASASPVHAAIVVVVVSVVRSFVCVPVVLVLCVALLVAVVFPEILVIVTGVASISGLLVSISVSVKAAMIGPIKLFRINTVLSLALFLSQSPACSL